MPLRYLKYTLDQHVENDYTIVYFHYGLSSQNKPSLGWLQNAYKEFDRKYVQGTFEGEGGTERAAHETEWWKGHGLCSGPGQMLVSHLVMERVHLGEGYRIAILLACCRTQKCIM